MGKATENLARVTRIGLDLAKNVFQVHGVGAQGEVVIARKLRRGTM
jgi:transposase